MKKTIISLALICMLLSAFVNPVQAAGQTLHAREDGSFRILIVSDTQDTEKPRQLMLDLLNAELDAADVDLVVLLGDNIYGPYIGDDKDKAESAIRAVMDPIAERNLPFAICFGNHDDENCISKEEQIAIYKSYPGCLNEDPDISGVGNTCLPLCAADSDEAKILLWLIDSGTYAEKEIGGFGYVKEDQIDWFKEGVADYNAKGAPTSYVFQHIAVPQAYRLLSPAKPFEKGAISSLFNPFSKWYKQNDDMISAGGFGETPGSPRIDSGEFSAWKDCGVKAAFFGHDHVNDFVGTVDGIDLIATSGIGFYAYGKGDEHGARMLVLHTDSPEEYETEMVYYKDLFDKPLSPFALSRIGIPAFVVVVSVLAGLALIITIIVVIIRKIVRRKRK